jgi:FO synthase
VEQAAPFGMDRALARAAAGKPLDLDEATVLLAARGGHLRRLCEAAARVRDAGLAAAGRPGVVTYSRKVFIPLTRLCRDRCHYCTFATVPGRLPSPYLSVDEVVAIAAQGAAMGCKEALFTLGDRPEDRWDAAREWLEAAGYDSTLSYLRACAVAVLESTGLLPHLNPGVMSWAEQLRLKPVAASMGMMLETTAEVPAHAGSPDKDPAVRLPVLEDAGRLSVPFTTGLLVGIGETLRDRAESVFAIRAAHRRHGHVQEVIVQNFVAKDDTAMRRVPDAEREEHLAAIAVTRLVMGPQARVQAPPNLVALDDVAALLAPASTTSAASARSPRPRQPREAVAAARRPRRRHRRAGFVLRERLTAHPALPRRAVARTRGCARTSRRCAGRTAWPTSAPSSSAGRGRSRRRPGDDRPGRPAREHRHRRPQRGPAVGLHRRLRRLGRGRGARRPHLRPRESTAPGCCGSRVRRGAAGGGRPAGGADAGRTRWRCCSPTAPTSTRWPPWPTTSAVTPSATTSPTW